MASLLSLVATERFYSAADGGFRLVVPDLSLEHGERVCVLGQSGTGKSTLLDLLAFLAPPSRSGHFKFRGDGLSHDLRDAWARRDRTLISGLRARHLGYILQTGGLLPYLSLRENALLSRRLLGLKAAGPIEHLAKALGVDRLMDRMPAQVSIGQRQRAAVIRALAHEPKLILADEPTAALNPDMAMELIDLLTASAEELGAALVLVTHDPSVVARAGGRLVQCRLVAGESPTTSIVEG